MMTTPFAANLATSRHRRHAAFVAVVALAATLLTPAVTAADTSEISGAADISASADDQFDEARALAADWIVGRYQAATYGGGSLADVVFALAATGGHIEVVSDVLEDLEAATPVYAFPNGNANLGAVAKVWLAVQVGGGDPHDWAGYDLEDELRSRVAEDGSLPGVNMFAAPLAVVALTRSDDGASDATVTWLSSHQCTEGPNTGAFGWSSNSCASADIDITALALQALHANGRDDEAALAADFLVGRRDENGDIATGGNTVSTGLAAQALRAHGHVGIADELAAGIVAMQFGPEADDPAHVGGIRWLRSQTTPNEMATFQAVLGLGAPAFPELAAHRAQSPTPPFDRGVDRVCDRTPPVRFDDVAATSTHARAVGCLEGHGITEGSSDPTRFDPLGTVTRGQMASFVDRWLRVAGRPLTAATVTFPDDGGTHRDAIRRLASAGVVRGRHDGLFAPGAPVTRAQAASLMARALDVLDNAKLDGSAPPPGPVGVFRDPIPGHADTVASLAGIGVVQGFADGTFGPATTMRRDQMASMLLRALDYAAEAGTEH